MGCGTFIVKVLLFVANFLVMAGGIAMIVVGALAYTSLSDFTGTFKGEFSVYPAIILGIGCVICFVGFSGCCGAISENVCLLQVYGGLMVLVFIATLTIGILVLTKREDVEQFVDKFFLNYFKEQYSGTPPESKSFDAIQKAFLCCGVNGPADYITYMIFLDTSVPQSCCKPDVTGSCNVLTAHKKGCLTDFREFLSGGVQAAGAVAVGVAALEIFAVIAAFFLANHVRNK